VNTGTTQNLETYLSKFVTLPDPLLFPPLATNILLHLEDLKLTPHYYLNERREKIENARADRKSLNREDRMKNLH
jgi:hypothetical protein